MTSRPVGLVAGGGVSRSFLARARALAERLGPVKAVSYRVASRIVNSIRAGHPVAECGLLDRCGVVLIAVPEASLPTVIAELGMRVDMSAKTVLLCDSWRDSLWLEPLRAAGACVASVNAVEGSNERRFVAEGDRQALREARRLFVSRGAKLIEIKRSSKPLYLSALTMAADLMLPLVAGAVESLRGAGLSRAEATPIVETLVLRSLRGYAKAGAKAWYGARAAGRRRAVEVQMDTLRSVDARLAEFYVESVARARAFFGRSKS